VTTRRDAPDVQSSKITWICPPGRYRHYVADQPTDDLIGGIATLPDARTEDQVRRARNWRRVGIVALWVFIIAGVSGFLGIQMSTTTATAAGWTLGVHAPRLTRGALDAPITITITREGGFTDKITLRVGRNLLDHLDANLVAPAPSAETGSPAAVDWTFDPPDGDTLTISIDARMSPSEMPGVDRLRFAVVARGIEVVEVAPKLVLLP
jgi:hypothetical protein